MARLLAVSLILVVCITPVFAHLAGMGTSNYTNSPTLNRNCTSCHGGPLNHGPGLLSINGLPTTGYAPGETYTLTIGLQQIQSHRWGLQQTVLLSGNPAARGGHLFTNNIYVAVNSGTGTAPEFANHTTTGTYGGNAGPVTWTVGWTAPAAGTGTVVFYTVGLACNNNNYTSGDSCYARVDSIREFTGQLPPRRFSLLRPVNENYYAAPPDSFSWQVNGDPNAGDTVSYKLFRSTDSTFATFDSSASVTTGYIRITTGWVPNTRYYWRVRAIDNRGNPQWSNETFTFDYLTHVMPSPFVLLAPANNSRVTTTPVIFRWQRSTVPNPTDTIRYLLLGWITGNPTLRDSAFTTDTAYTWVDAMNDSAYTWIVSANDGHGNIRAAMEPFSFQMYMGHRPTGTITLLTPTNNATISNPQQTFSWTGITDSDSGDAPTYSLWVKQGTDSTRYAAGTNTNLMLTITSIPNFRWGTTLTWWVIGNTLYPPVQTPSLSRFTLTPVSGVNDERGIPVTLSLAPAFPNPFNSTTHLMLSLPHSAPVTAVLYNMTGQVVGNFEWGRLNAGRHELSFNGTALSSGTYLLRCRVGNEYLGRSFTLLK